MASRNAISKWWKDFIDPKQEDKKHTIFVKLSQVVIYLAMF